jgi:hypothetical protein
VTTQESGGLVSTEPEAIYCDHEPFRQRIEELEVECARLTRVVAAARKRQGAMVDMAITEAEGRSASTAPIIGAERELRDALAALPDDQHGDEWPNPSKPTLHRCTLDGDTCWVCGDYWPCVTYTDSLGI